MLSVPPLPDDLEEALWRVAAARLPEDRLRPRALAPAIAELSRRYTVDRARLGAAGAAGPELLAARLLFFGASDAPKLAVPLGELARAGALPAAAAGAGTGAPPTAPLRVLDVGAGTGAMTLGLLAFLRAAGAAGEVVATLVDGDAAALALAAAALAEAAPRCGTLGPRVVVRLADVRRLDEVPAGPFDLIVAGTLLNELWPEAGDRIARRAALAAGLAERLAAGGSLILVEPALREQARELEEVRARLLAAGLTIFAPCPHAGPCPMLARERDWCHEARALAPSPRLAELARLTALRHGEARFAYLTVRAAGPTLAAALAAPWRVVSHPLPGKGKTTLDLCGAGRRVRVERLTRARAAASAPLDDARRGDLLALTPEPGPGALVRLAPDCVVRRR